MKKGLFLTILFAVLFFYSTAIFSQYSTNALYFDGVDDRVTAYGNPAYSGLLNGDFSIDFWFRPDSGVGSYNILSMWDTTANMGFKIVMYANDIYASTSYSVNSFYSISEVLPNSIYNGECHHIAYVVQGNKRKLYVDGVSTLNYSQSSWNVPPIVIHEILFGTDHTPSTYSPYKGMLSRLRIWKYALTQFDIINSFSNSVSQPISKLVADWKFENKYKQKIEDYSLIQNHAVKGLSSISETSDPVSTGGCQSCTATSVNIQKLSSTSFCAGDSCTLKVKILPGFSCQWYKNGIAIAGQTDSLLAAKTGGVYSARFTNGMNCRRYSNAVLVSIYFSDITKPKRLGESPTWNASAACYWTGRKDTLQVAKNVLYSYQWYKSGVLIPNATSYKLAITDTGEYTCLVSTASCSKMSYGYDFYPLVVDVLPLTTPLTCMDTLVTLEANLPWSYQPQYIWKANGTVIPNATTSTITTSATGNITCTVNDSNYCPATTTSQSIYVAHNQSPNLFVRVNYLPLSSSQTISLCTGVDMALFKLVDQYGLSYLDAGLQSINWSVDFPVVIHAPDEITVLQSGTYDAFYSTLCGSGHTGKTIYFTGPGVPAPSITAGTPGCNTVQLTLNTFLVSWPSYQWYRDSVLIPGATGSSYLALQGGNYICVLDNSCDTLGSTPIRVNTLLETYNIVPVNGTAICGGIGKLLTATGGNAFQWRKNGNAISGATLGYYTATTTGKYTCRITGTCGVVFSDTITITNGTALVPPVVGIQGPDSVCPNNSIHHYSIATVPGSVAYSWKLPNGATLYSPEDSNEVDIKFSYGFQGGMIYFLGINNCGADTLSSLYVNSLQPPRPILLSGDVYGLCNLTESFVIDSNPLVTNYVWTVPNGTTILSGQGTDSIVVQFGSGLNSGNLTVYGEATCKNSDVLSVQLKGAPANPGPISGQTNVCANQSNLVYTIPPVIGATYYQWTLPPGATQLSFGNSNSITIKMGTTTGPISVRPVNVCNNAQTSIKYLNIVCREEEQISQPVMQMNLTQENHHLTVSVEGMDQQAIVSLYSSLGQLIGKELIESTQDGIAVFGNLSNGIYMVEVSSGDQRIVGKAIIN